MLARKIEEKKGLSKTKKDEERLTSLEKNQMRSNRITAFLLILSLFLSTLVAIGFLPITDSPNTTAYETIERIGENEQYKIMVYNYGSIAHNLRIEIDLPSNTIFTTLEDLGTPLTKIKEIIGENYDHYYVIFESIQENENIGIRMLLQNDDMKNNDSLTIKPKVSIWTDEEGQIEIR